MWWVRAEVQVSRRELHTHIHVFENTKYFNTHTHTHTQGERIGGLKETDNNEYSKGPHTVTYIYLD